MESVRIDSTRLPTEAPSRNLASNIVASSSDLLRNAETSVYRLSVCGWSGGDRTRSCCHVKPCPLSHEKVSPRSLQDWQAGGCPEHLALLFLQCRQRPLLRIFLSSVIAIANSQGFGTMSEMSLLLAVCCMRFVFSLASFEDPVSLWDVPEHSFRRLSAERWTGMLSFIVRSVDVAAVVRSSTLKKFESSS